MVNENRKMWAGTYFAQMHRMQFNANDDFRETMDASEVSQHCSFVHFIREISRSTCAGFATWELFSLLSTSRCLRSLYLFIVLQSLIIATFKLHTHCNKLIISLHVRISLIKIN